MNYLLSRKNLVAAISLLALFTGSIASAEKHKSHSSDSCCKSVKKQLKRLAKKHAPKECCECEPICQEKINEAGGTLILRKSGNYALKHDVTGTIVVAADSVCIDLCCHTLSAGGRANAIVANGHEGLDVFNGRIINATDAAILVQNYNATELYDLTMSSNLLDAIREQNSTDVNVHDVNFINDNSGERALWLDTCDNIVVKDCNASGFLSTIGAVVQLDTCNAVSMQDVDVTNNTKSQAVPTGSFATDASFINMNTCTGIDLVHVKVNNNTFNTTAVGSRRGHCIAFVDSNSCSMDRCETSNNTDISGDNGNNLIGSVDRMVFVGLTDNVIITEHQANNNSCTQPITSFRAYNIRDSLNIVFDGCQANNNSVSELLVTPNANADLTGFYIQFAGISPENYMFRNCQANFNVAASGGSGRTTTGSEVVGLLLQGSAIVESCQFNHNFIGGTEPLTGVFGILAELGVSNTIFLNTTADNNTGGGETAPGILIYPSNSSESNISVIGCSASSNGTQGLVLGRNPNGTPDPSTLTDIFISNSVFNENGGAIGDTAGIAILFPNTGGISNVLIKGCQIYDTFATAGAATGISAAGAKNVVIEDTNVFNTTADGLGHGILFDTMTDSKIIRTQVHGNQNSGIEIIGDNSTIAIIESIAMDNDIGYHFDEDATVACSLVQDSRALNNATAGFSYEPATLTVTFIGNEAQCNGPCVDFNYAHLNTTINLQQISWTNGAFTPVNPVGPGQAAIGARFTNMRGPGPVCTP